MELLAALLTQVPDAARVCLIPTLHVIVFFFNLTQGTNIILFEDGSILVP